MSIYALKPKFQNLLRPLVQRLFNAGITANQVTIFACLVSVILGVFLCIYAQNHMLFFLLPVWLFLRMALNAIDGMLARECGQQSALGGYLNELTDVIADAALYLPFAWVQPFSPLQMGLFIWLAALSEMAGILGAVHGNTRRYDGPIGKSDRAFVIGALGLAYAIFSSLPSWAYGLMWVVLVLLVVTIYRRVKNGLG